jgi:toxoflavin synthase
MSEQYDAIGAAYEGFKALPMARYVERDNVLTMLGDVHGKAVVDLACGTGFYTRQIRMLGARRVVGIDISAEMVKAAQALEAEKPLGIDYRVADAADLPVFGSFDLVNAVYLLNYAEDEAAMKRMCDGAFRNLTDEGEFTILTQNPDFSFAGPQLTKYGFTFTAGGPVPTGVRVIITAHLDPPITFETFIIDRDVYERALAAAGFTDITWRALRIPDAAVREFGPHHWDDFTANPPLIMLSCRR